MGSDLGHEEDDVFFSPTSSKWSRNEKELLRLILSNRIGSIIMCLLIEGMMWNYVNLIYLLATDHDNVGNQVYYAIKGTIYFLSGMQMIGASYIKSRNKRIFVFVLVFTFMFLLVGYGILRGSIYVAVVTVLSSIIFEVVVVFLYGLVSKNMPVIKLVTFVSFILLCVLFTVMSNKHGYNACNLSLTSTNHSHYSQGCSEYTTFSLLTDFLPPYVYPSYWNSKTPKTISDISITLDGDVVTQFSCQNALQQAKLVSVLEQRHVIEQELKHHNQEGHLSLVIERYRKRRMAQNRISQKYQPIMMRKAVQDDVYLYDCKSTINVVAVPAAANKTKGRSVMTVMFSDLSHSTFSNEMKLTKRVLEGLKRFDYSIYQFSDFETEMNSTLYSLMEGEGRHLMHVARPRFRVISTASNVCEDIWKQITPGKELMIDNDGVVFTCLKSLFEDHDKTAAAVDFMVQMDRNTQQQQTTSASFLYLETKLPLQSIDQQVARLLEQETSGGKPILVLAGIRGNRGYVLDMIPCQSKESTNPVLLLAIPRETLAEFPELEIHLRENIGKSVSPGLFYNTLADLFQYPDVFSRASLLRRLG